jgi:3-hydroxyisobutyrate dehydrogenase-like beta-hydroxyacid dehydrogenase
MRIAFIGFGEAGRAFCDSLAVSELHLDFSAYDILLDSEGAGGAAGEAMRERGVAIAGSAEAAVADANWVFSAVSADQCLAAAKAVLPGLRAKQVFFDINSVSPVRKRESARLVTATGSLYVDMAVMGPVHPDGHRTPTLLAGASDAALVQRLQQLGFNFEIAGPRPGAATAVKMVRSLFVKGLEAITVETLLAASASECLDYVLGSLATSYPGLDLPEFAHYQLERTMKHGARRAAEMLESAATLDDLGLHGELARAIADVQQMMGSLPCRSFGSTDLPNALAELVASRHNPRGASSQVSGGGGLHRPAAVDISA